MVRKFLELHFGLHDRLVSKDDSLLTLCNYFKKKGDNGSETWGLDLNDV